MRIEKITENKKQFLELLLLADEQENMIDKYLPDGELFALYDGGLKSACVVVPVDSPIWPEISLVKVWELELE